MKKRALFVIFSLLFTTAFAQDEMFRVLASKGTNKVVSGNSSEWKSVGPGKKLFKDDKISIDENGYLALAHKNGKTMELKKAGIYEVSKLNSELASQNSSVTKKYVDYIAGEMTNTGGENMSENRKKYMNVTGSVDRGIGDVKLMAFKETVVLNGITTLRWAPTENVKVYQVTIMNMFDEPVYTTETSETFITVDLSKLGIKKDRVLSWHVKDKASDKKSDKYSLKYISEEKEQKINADLKELKANLSDETAINKMILASYFEENNLYLNALENYESAKKLQPDVEEFKETYELFSKWLIAGKQN
ncbi:MAG: hypothetical protein ACK40G_06375 [Cytophagaceae bacterium]